jgi:glycosyltransferase involved in cell wall biosynthesis
MKILLVTPDYPPYNKGGGGAFYKSIAERLSERGHDVRVIAGYYNKGLPENGLIYNAGGKIEFSLVPLMNIFRHKFIAFQSYFPPTLKSLWYLKSINYEEYDIIHLMAFGHLLIDAVNYFGKQKNSKLILTIHGYPKYSEHDTGGINYIIKLLYSSYYGVIGKYTIKSSKVICVPSAFVAKETLRKGFSSAIVKIIPNGIDLRLYEPQDYSEFERRYNLTSDHIVMLSIGRIYWFKGFEYAIASIPLAIGGLDKPIKYIIMGQVEDQAYFASLNRQIEKLNLKDTVIFTGYVDQKYKLDALTRSDIFIVPSIHESFGIIALEAMAMGKPIIATDIEGISGILEDMKTGLLVKPARPNQLAEAITMLSKDPVLRSHLSKNAKNMAKRYDWSNIVDQYEKVYKI